jgi:hypothetical protein
MATLTQKQKDLLNTPRPDIKPDAPGIVPQGVGYADTYAGTYTPPSSVPKQTFTDTQVQNAINAYKAVTPTQGYSGGSGLNPTAADYARLPGVQPTAADIAKMGQGGPTAADIAMITPKKSAAQIAYEKAAAAEKARVAAETEQKAKQAEQTSQNTSAVFNDTTRTGVKNVADRFRAFVTTNQATPWDSNGAKQENHGVVLNTFASEFAKQFANPEQFAQAYNTDKTVKDAMDFYTRSGGDIANITNRIVSPISGSPTVTGPQTLTEYLSSMGQTTPATADQISAYNATAGDRKASEQEILRQNGVKDEYLQLYHGDNGIWATKKAEADEKIRIAKEKEENTKATLREKMQAANERLRAERDSQRATVEENRVNAKNYMSGMLAKLGALNTTSSAVDAITILDEKYQKQSTELDSKYNLAVNDNEISLNEAVRKAEETRDDSILAATNDLSLTKEEAMKNIFTAKLTAEKEIAKEQADYAKLLRETNAKYTEAAQKQSAEYLKKYGTATGADTVSFWAKMIRSGSADIANVPADLKNEVVVAMKGNVPASSTVSKTDKAANLENDIASSVLNFRDIVKQNGWAGIDPTQYQGLVTILKNKYGAAAVLKLEKALEDAGLSVDNGQ